MKYKSIFLKDITAPQPGDEENYIIRGVFSSGQEDRQGDIVVQNGWMLDEFRENPVVLFAHDHWQPAVGMMIDLGFNEKGELAGAIKFAAKEYDFAMTLYLLYKGKYMRAFSAGFECIDGGYDQANDIQILKQNILYEVSCVNVGANAQALAVQNGIDISPLSKFMSKQLDKRKYYLKNPVNDGKIPEYVESKIKELKVGGYEEEQAEAIAYSICERECPSIKSVVPYKDWGKEPEDTEWDGPKQIGLCGEDIEKLKDICAWYDSENADVKSSYKLPHHLAENKHAVWKGVASAMSVLLGGMGGVDIPEEEKQGVYNHLAKHYKEFDKEPPEMKSYCCEDLKKIYHGEEIGSAEERIHRLEKSLNKATREIKTLTARQREGRLHRKGKKILIKTLNKAVRSLLREEKSLKNKRK